MGYNVQYTGYNPHPGPSPRVWSKCPVLEKIEDPGIAYEFFDEFMDFRDVAAAEGEGPNGYGTLADTSCSISGVVDVVGGVIRLALDNTGDRGASIATGGKDGSQFPIGKLTKGDGKAAWFEARFRINDVTNAHGWFLGLAGLDQLGTTEVIANGCGALASGSFIGFRVVDTDPNGIDSVYKVTTTETEVVSATVIEADTWIKLGFYWDADDVLHYFVDGEEIGSVDVGALSTSDLANFPDGTLMVMMFGAKQGGTAINFDLDWWRFVQLR